MPPAPLLGAANIIIDQATLDPGIAGKSRNDGVPFEVVTLKNADNTNVLKHQWVLERPRGSNAFLSSPASASCQFTPDRRGTYAVTLYVNEGKARTQVMKRLLGVKTDGGLRYPAQSEGGEANWTSLFTGNPNETGWWEDLIQILQTIQAGVEGSVLTVDPEGGLPLSRQLIAGNGVVFNDSGPGTTLEIRSTSGVIRYPDVIGEAENLVASRGTKPSDRDNTKYGQLNLGSQTNNTYGTADNYATILGGLDNLASAEGTFVGGGLRNRATDLYAVVGGGALNFAVGQYAAILGGNNNEIAADNCAIGGGDSNTINDAISFIGGGQANVIDVQYSAICGGYFNTIPVGGYGFIGGGYTNTLSSSYSSIVAGYFNAITAGDYSFIGGGYQNTSDSLYNAIGGGSGNSITGGTNAFIGGGYQNEITAGYAVVAGGYQNSADGVYACVLGGIDCHAIDPWTAVIGGNLNNAQGSYSIVLGGQLNNTGGGNTAILAGYNNLTSGSYGAVVGGNENYAGHDNAVVAGGHLNQAIGPDCFVAAGSNNIASNTSCGIIGSDNTAQGNYSYAFGRSCFAGNDNTIAIGRSASPIHAGSHVYKDGAASTVQSTADNQLTASYTGGIRLLFPSAVLRRSGYSGSSNYVDEVHGSASTTNATPATSTIITIPSGQDVHIRGVLKGKRSGTADARSLVYEATYTNNGGTVALVGAAVVNSAQTAGVGNTWATAVNINGSTLEIAITGAAAQTIRWTWNFTCTVGGAT